MNPAQARRATLEIEYARNQGETTRDVLSIVPPPFSVKRGRFTATFVLLDIEVTSTEESIVRLERHLTARRIRVCRLERP